MLETSENVVIKFSSSKFQGFLTLNTSRNYIHSNSSKWSAYKYMAAFIIS